MNGLVIACYNRAQYLKQCLESISACEIPPDTLIVLIDDHSTDAEAKQLFAEFYIPDVEIVKMVNQKNSGIAFSLLKAYNRCFTKGCNVVTNLDNDAIVKPDFLKKVFDFYGKHPRKIVTAFNSMTKNANGTERHHVIERSEGYVTKKSVGGINMVCDQYAFANYIEPALHQSINKTGNWDHMACINAAESGNPVVCMTPSLVQHIGFESSMNHREQPDIAEDFFNLMLPDVTLIGVDCVNLQRLYRVVEISTKDIRFGDIKILSSQPSKSPHYLQIRNIASKEQYSTFIIRELTHHVKTSHVLIIQYDGYVINWKAWSDEFLQYDYIGATWWYKDNMNVGNGGFSLRSKKLLDTLSSDENIKELHPEDHHICRTYRPYLESIGFKFAPEEVANRFAIEACNIPKEAANYGGQFGFHGAAVKGLPADKMFKK
jgi:glycosyltransferase involved in cell wall biosynthesis